MRTSKQLCKTAQPPTSVDGVKVQPGNYLSIYGGALVLNADYLSQSCEATSLYSPDAFEVPYGFSLPYAVALGATGAANPEVEPYANTVQSRNLRVIESALNPKYQAKNDTLEFNTDYAITTGLTFTSQTGYNRDFLSSTEDYNRFNTSPGIFSTQFASNYPADPTFSGESFPTPLLEQAASEKVQLYSAILNWVAVIGLSRRICPMNMLGNSVKNSGWLQISSGPLNFSVGGNYLHYETEENYYVFINALTAYAVISGDHFGRVTDPSIPATPDNSDCLQQTNGGYQLPNPLRGSDEPTQGCIYIDPNPITSLNNYGHNYFLSQNPYTLNSYAGFGEVSITSPNDLKLTGGLRWTEDRKHFTDIPSELVATRLWLPHHGGGQSAMG